MKKRWIYARNNAYDLVIAIDGNIAYYITQNSDFPILTKLDMDEQIEIISKFMGDVMVFDNSNEWEFLNINEILDGCTQILWDSNELNY